MLVTLPIEQTFNHYKILMHVKTRLWKGPMIRQIRLLLGISIFWLALSILIDGMNTLVLPLRVAEWIEEEHQATALGLFTTVGLLLAALIQPVAGAFSDRWKPVLGRKGFIAMGVALTVLSIVLFLVVKSLIGLMLGYLLIQSAAAIAQAGQQGLIPDLVEAKRRGLASGWKGFMDMTGAMLGFVILGQLLGADRLALALGLVAAILVITYLLAVLLTPEDKPASTTASAGATSFLDFFRLGLKEHSAFKRVLVARFLFLFGIYAIGRFLLLFVARRLDLNANAAAEQAGTLLAALAFVTIVASPVAGWLADRLGRTPLMLAGALLGGISALLLIAANTAGTILLFGSLMSLGSAAFASASWAYLADIVPSNEPARYFGLANFSTAGPVAAAGLLGPLIDAVESVSPGNGYTVLFVISALAFFSSVIPVRNAIREIGEQDGNKRKDSAHAARLAVLRVQADPSVPKEDQDPPRGAA